MKFAAIIVGLAFSALASDALAEDLLDFSGQTVIGPTQLSIAIGVVSTELTVVSPEMISKMTSAKAKLAVVNASPDAIALLDGQEPTDLFKQGRDAAEYLLNLHFASDAEAAMAILSLSQ